METTRAFVAVELGGGATSVLERVIKELKANTSGVRWSRREQLHLTLKFVGDVDNRELPRLCDSVRAACAACPPFSLQLRGLGAFPKNKPPRVLWVGVEEGTQELRGLAERLDQQLAELGVPRETRLFTPHLTLGRVGRGADMSQLEPAIAAMSERVALRCEINDIILMASLKQQAEMIYEPIDTVELEG